MQYQSILTLFTLTGVRIVPEIYFGEDQIHNTDIFGGGQDQIIDDKPTIQTLTDIEENAPTSLSRAASIKHAFLSLLGVLQVDLDQTVTELVRQVTGMHQKLGITSQIRLSKKIQSFRKRS